MRTMHQFLAAAVIAGLATSSASAQTEARQTNVMVRVIARDAKLIGDAVGGVRITIRDVRTDEVLATGVTRGGTGDTDAIMHRARERGASVFDSPGAAGWLASLDLAEPTLVEITAEGPLGFPEIGARASRRLLLAPGADIEGDGIVLELNGFIVEIIEAVGVPSGGGVRVEARVRMLCSCPTEPGGLWSVRQVTARLMDGQRIVAESTLEFSGRTSIYAGTVRVERPGRYTVVVLAEDPATANFGEASAVVRVAGERRP